MTSILAISSGSVPTIVGIGLLVYFAVSIAILWAYARTRLYPLYLLKIVWVSFTILGFLWMIAMSFGDPGSRHGGVTATFLANPAGPFAALGDYTTWAARLYVSTPWWLLLLAPLLLLWRGLVGDKRADLDSPRAQINRARVLGGIAAVVWGILLLTDHFYPSHLATLREAYGWSGGRLQYTGAVAYAIVCATWMLLPMRIKRAASGWLLAALGLMAAAPLVMSLIYFDWSAYSYVVSNYTFAWKTARMGKYMLNSLLVSVLTFGVTTIFASMAAYALARFEFFGRHLILFGFVGAMVIPAQLYIVPLFLTVKDWQISLGGLTLNFMDSRLGLGLIYAAAGLPFAIFLLTGFYRTLPGGLREAAAIDGCGEWRLFTDVYFPLAAPGMATAAIFQFLGVWNEYQFALVFLTNDQLKTLPVGLYNLSVSQQYAANWPALFAGVTILCVPTFLIFVILQERIVAGLTVGAVKE